MIGLVPSLNHGKGRCLVYKMLQILHKLTVLFIDFICLTPTQQPLPTPCLPSFNVNKLRPSMIFSISNLVTNELYFNVRYPSYYNFTFFFLSESKQDAVKLLPGNHKKYLSDVQLYYHISFHFILLYFVTLFYYTNHTLHQFIQFQVDFFCILTSMSIHQQVQHSSGGFGCVSLFTKP